MASTAPGPDDDGMPAEAPAPPLLRGGGQRRRGVRLRERERQAAEVRSSLPAAPPCRQRVGGLIRGHRGRGSDGQEVRDDELHDDGSSAGEPPPRRPRARAEVDRRRPWHSPAASSTSRPRRRPRSSPPWYSLPAGLAARWASSSSCCKAEQGRRGGDDGGGSEEAREAIGGSSRGLRWAHRSWRTPFIRAKDEGNARERLFPVCPVRCRSGRETFIHLLQETDKGPIADGLRPQACIEPCK
jgi:hypothetical protein